MLSKVQFNQGKRFSSSKVTKTDLTIIGGGPGGYVAAIRAAHNGLKVTCIEKRGKLGGTCLNVGCIPSKALLHSSHLYHSAKHDFSKYGLSAPNVSVDVGLMMKQKENAVDGLTGGIEFLFKKNKVNYIKGTATLEDKNTVSVKTNDGKEETVVSDNILIASGSEHIDLNFAKVDEKQIISSTGALSLPKVPPKMVVIGAGVIGLELGSVWSRLGSQVTFIEFLDRIAPGVDNAIAKQLKRTLEQQSMKFELYTKATAVERNGSKLVVTAANRGNNKEKQFDCDVVMVAIGRKPYTKNLGLEKLGIETDKYGRIIVNKQYQTKYPNIYAIGDVIEGPMLAHKAEEEGMYVVDALAGKKPHINYNAIPGVIYTTPEVAWVGLSEEDALAKGLQIKTGSVPFRSNSRAKTIEEVDGLVKFICDANSGEILGAHIMGPNASEMVHECVVAMEQRMTADKFAAVCHAHPTFSEAVKEGAMAVFGKAIHV